MELYQFLTLVALLAGGFAWMVTWLRSIDGRINEMDKRIVAVELRMNHLEIKVSVIETILNFRDSFQSKYKERAEL
jgi:hypothetical protein